MRLRMTAMLAIGALAWWRYRSAWHADARRSSAHAEADVAAIDPRAIIRPKRNVDPNMAVRADPGIDPGGVVVPRPQPPKARRSRS